MNVHSRSTNISLHLFAHGSLPWDYTGLNQLWQTLRRTAVEPIQASSPDIFSFADECLLCAYIVINTPFPVPDAGENTRALFTSSSHTLLQDHTPTPSQTHSMESLPPYMSEGQRLGLIYLHAGPANLPAGEASIGVIMEQDMRSRGYAREAVQLVLRWAFEELKFHRVQAAIPDTLFKDRALRLFIGSGFVHEGTRRRAVYQPEEEGVASMWKDVTYLAMLDTEWMLWSTWTRDNQVQGRPVITVWDEMFTRHAKEREELLSWEEKHGRIRRSSSTETLRENVRNVPQDLAYLTDDASSSGEPSVSGSGPPSPIPSNVVIWDDEAVMETAPGIPERPQQWGTMAGWQGQDALLQVPTLDRVLSLPSIPSPVLSEHIPQSPVTILTSSSPRSTPPSSPSPSPSPAPSIHAPWTDSEDEGDWLPVRDFPLSTPTIQFVVPHAGYASVSARSRSVSGSSSSSDPWSDAEDASSSAWEVISDTSDHGHRVHVWT